MRRAIRCWRRASTGWRDPCSSFSPSSKKYRRGGHFVAVGFKYTNKDHIHLNAPLVAGKRVPKPPSRSGFPALLELNPSHRNWRVARQGGERCTFKIRLIERCTLIVLLLNISGWLRISQYAIVWAPPKSTSGDFEGEATWPCNAHSAATANRKTRIRDCHHRRIQGILHHN